jgi:hypothetical protein
MKKGQVTIFVVLGIVLVAIFAFAMLARTALIKDNLQVKAQTMVDSAASQALNTYVSSCVEKIAKDGIKLIYIQGGNLYTDQRGPINFSIWTKGSDYLPYNYSNRTINVSYAIHEYENCNITTPFLSPPLYPYPFSYLADVQRFFTAANVNNCTYYNPTKYSGFYGSNDLSRLCSLKGPNKYQNNSDVRNYTCDPMYFSYDSRLSMQDQLDYYIEQHLPYCTNFSDFNQRSSGKMSIINKPKVQVVYGINNAVIKANYPFIVNIDGKQVTTVYDFSTPLPLNLKGLYSCAFDLVKKEAQDVFFNKTSSFYTLSNCNGYTYNEYREVCPQCTNASFDDIISIADPHSIIDGTPLTFLFGIKNRRPALEYIHNDTYYAYRLIADLQFRENDTIIVKPQGFDPDEGLLHYNYSLWREDYEEYFNASCCSVVDCSINLSQCMVRNYTNPKNWTSSLLFQQTKKDAAYQSQYGEAGLHFVNISVWDKEGLLDYQIVRILIFDVPIAVINGSNLYDDINNSLASIEDPYYLNGSESRKSTLLSNGSFYFYQWNDSYEPFQINTTVSYLRIPNESYSINNSENNTIRYLNFTRTGIRNISLMVSQQTVMGNITSFPGLYEVNVLACLPHRNDSASWPYNDINNNGYVATLNPFFANHTCCSDDLASYGTILNGSQCFLFLEYSSIFTFTHLDRNALQLTIDYPSYVASIYPDVQVNEYEKRNDIYFRNFTRSCSGDRGNICDGPMGETIVNMVECTGDASTQEEACSGPDSMTPTDNLSQIACMHYPLGQTFETKFNLDDKNNNPANGYCDKDFACANGTATQFNPQGVFWCQSLCSSGACSYPTNCTCRSGPDAYGNTCTASPSCDLKDPGFAWNVSGIKKESGCSNACQALVCTPYVFNPTTEICYTASTSTNANQCDDGYFWDVSDHKCVSGNANHIETGGDTPDNQCEQGLGASPQCDEKSPGNLCLGIINTGICDGACQFNNRGTCDAACGATMCLGLKPGDCSSNHKVCTAACTESGQSC